MEVDLETNPKTMLSPKQKLDSKNAAMKLKYGSPKLVDMLREKCRIRVKAARSSKFDNGRFLQCPNEQKNFITRILRQEIANNLELDIAMQEQIYMELSQEADEWFVEEMERDENHLIQQIEENLVICPVCMRSNLTVENGIAFCLCGVRFDGSMGLEYIFNVIQHKFQEHESFCGRAQSLKFFTEPNQNLTNSNSLLVLCEFCDYFAVVLN